MTTDQLRRLIKQQLPELLKEDPEIRELVLRLSRGEFADKKQTEDRFTQLLNELRRDREEQARKWDENREEQNRKWEEQSRKWEEQSRNWEEQNKKWWEQNKKWEQNQRQLDKFHEEFDRVHDEIMAMADKLDRKIGALGARWGSSSEQAFRNALAGILEKSFGVEVLNVTEYDDEGVVFGHPDQVELDVIIKNGTLILCEIKSSVDKAAMYTFERKVRFYEKKHGRKADRMLVISPMIDPKARKVGEALGIEMYSDSSEVKPG